MASIPKPLTLESHPDYLEWLDREELEIAYASNLIARQWELKKIRKKGHHSNNSTPKSPIYQKKLTRKPML